MFSYTAYGLGIHSVLELPELLQREARPDAIVRTGPVDPSPPEGADGADWIWAKGDEACLLFDEAGKFLVRNGQEIIIEPVPNVDQDLVRVLLLGPVLSLLLHQRGYLVLHASCVAIDGGAVAFLADKGMGKSTLAGAFVRRGFNIVADDIIAVDIDQQGKTLVHPGFGQLKLWPDAVKALGEDPAALPTINSYLDKRARKTRQFSSQAMPLRGVYVLEEAIAQQAIEPLPPQEIFRLLCEHSYVLPLLKATGKLTAHFHQSLALAREVPVRRLLRRKEHSALDELVDLVVKDVAERAR